MKRQHLVSWMMVLAGGGVATVTAILFVGLLVVAYDPSTSWWPFRFTNMFIMKPDGTEYDLGQPLHATLFMGGLAALATVAAVTVALGLRRLDSTR